MNCDDAQSLLHAYLDVELDPPTVLQYEQHLRECPACARTLAEQKALQTAMTAGSLYYQAPAHLHQRLRSSLQGQSRRPQRFFWRSLVAAACLLLCAGLGFVLARVEFTSSRDDRLIQEVAASHIRSLQWKHLVDVPSSDKHVVKPWFNGKLDFPPPVVAPSTKDFPLLGGRLDYLDGRPVAALVYKRRAHFINVFLWPGPANEDTEPRRDTYRGYQLIHWSRAGMNYWIVSDLDPRELHDLAEQLRR
jgi:anti-sigma factor RsiW